MARRPPRYLSTAGPEGEFPAGGPEDDLPPLPNAPDGSLFGIPRSVCCRILLKFRLPHVLAVSDLVVRSCFCRLLTGSSGSSAW